MSSDATPEVLARYSHLRVIREPDSGLYDALNKGIRAATGEVIGHLNSDDVYTPGTFAAVAEAFANPKIDAVSGGAEILDAQGRPSLRFVRRPEIALTFANVTLGAPLPNARFFRRRVYDRVGLYDAQYRVAADREFLFRVALTGPRAVEMEKVFYQYRSHADSLTFGSNAAAEARWRDEYLAIAEKFLGDRGLPREARACTRGWHLRESAQAAARALLGGRFLRAANYAARGCGRNLTWPAMFLRHLGGAVLGR
jgi:glycosyltransferase involved in cell wall biosynthesis